jgi:hypothetical protein
VPPRAAGLHHRIPAHNRKVAGSSATAWRIWIGFSLLRIGAVGLSDPRVAAHAGVYRRYSQWSLLGARERLLPLAEAELQGRGRKPAVRFRVAEAEASAGGGVLANDRVVVE